MIHTQTPAPSTAHLTRQLDLIPIESLDLRITIIGAGAIGSFTALSLAKMGFSNITVFDDDKIEIENMSCQFYRHSDIGKHKATALAELIYDFTGVRIEAISKRYEEGTFAGVVIAAVDSMEARKLIWGNHCQKAPATKFIVDPRMGAETALMYVMNPMSVKDSESYSRSLYLDSEAVQERCTAKATVYTATMLSGLVAKAVKDIAKGDNYPRTTMWSIAMDDFKSWRSDNNECN